MYVTWAQTFQSIKSMYISVSTVALWVCNGYNCSTRRFFIASHQRSKAEATTEEPSVPPPQLTRQQQIDALKVHIVILWLRVEA